MKDLHDPETRVTDYATGGQKGAKLTRLGALDPVALIELARVAGMGAEKYAAFNFLKGYDWSLSFNAMMRHALLFWAGETEDPESGLNHMAHAAWMALSLVSFSEREVGTDDRFVQGANVPLEPAPVVQLEPPEEYRTPSLPPLKCLHPIHHKPDCTCNVRPEEDRWEEPTDEFKKLHPHSLLGGRGGPLMDQRWPMKKETSTDWTEDKTRQSWDDDKVPGGAEF